VSVGQFQIVISVLLKSGLIYKGEVRNGNKIFNINLKRKDYLEE